jgi:hypothetical protein
MIALPPGSDPAMQGWAGSAGTQADRIRHFVRDCHVVPARRSGLAEITVRAGDVHRDMGLANAMPAVCSAIGSNRFAQLADVTLIERTGPANGANVYFRFSLDPCLAIAPDTPQLRATAIARAADTPSVDLIGALVLISCVKSKLPYAAPARSLYTSTWFTGVRDFTEASGARWLLLSSRYGLVTPDTVIAPYDYTLNSLGVDERKGWAEDVLKRLLPEAADFRRIVMFAGFRYREFLIQPLESHGTRVEVPLRHLRRGEQLAWLTRHR